MLFDPNADVTIGQPSQETPRAPSQNRLSAHAIVTGDPEAPNQTWTTRAEVKEAEADKLKQFRLSPRLNQSGGSQRYSIFFPEDVEIPEWVKPGEKVFIKLDYSGQAISGELTQRAAMTSFAIEENLSTPWFVTETS